MSLTFFSNKTNLNFLFCIQFSLSPKQEKYNFLVNQLELFVSLICKTHLSSVRVMPKKILSSFTWQTNLANNLWKHISLLCNAFLLCEKVVSQQKRVEFTVWKEKETVYLVIQCTLRFTVLTQLNELKKFTFKNILTSISAILRFS